MEDINTGATRTKDESPDEIFAQLGIGGTPGAAPGQEGEFDFLSTFEAPGKS